MMKGEENKGKKEGKGRKKRENINKGKNSDKSDTQEKKKDILLFYYFSLAKIRRFYGLKKLVFFLYFLQFYIIVCWENMFSKLDQYSRARAGK